MKMIWATRGRTWGFRFLDGGGFPDPLVVYDQYFAGVGEGPEVWRPGGIGEPLALRFPDPMGRRDEAGRTIPHEFIIFPPDSESLNSFEVCRERVWAQVKDRFAEIWNTLDPSSTSN